MHIFALAAMILTPEAPFAPGFLASAKSSTGRYADCIAVIATDLEIGRKAAEAWVIEGGGAPALHCQAVGELAAGLPKLAAIRLEEIARRKDAGDDVARARLFGEAALAWLDAGLHEEAQAAVAAAKKFAPTLAEIDFVAAKSYAAAQKWQAASDAVSALEASGARSPEAFLIRARASWALGRQQEAAEDVVAALTLDPLNVDALTLRGELQQAGIEIEAYYDGL